MADSPSISSCSVKQWNKEDGVKNAECLTNLCNLLRGQRGNPRETSATLKRCSREVCSFKNSAPLSGGWREDVCLERTISSAARNHFHRLNGMKCRPGHFRRRNFLQTEIAKDTFWRVALKKRWDLEAQMLRSLNKGAGTFPKEYNLLETILRCAVFWAKS